MLKLYKARVSLLAWRRWSSSPLLIIAQSEAVNTSTRRARRANNERVLHCVLIEVKPNSAHRGGEVQTHDLRYRRMPLPRPGPLQSLRNWRDSTTRRREPARD